MATQIIQEINRTVVAIANSSTQAFAAIRVPKQNHDILIKSITWGSLLFTAADQTNFRGHFACILRNTSQIDENYVPSSFAPIFQNGIDVLWSGTQNSRGGQNHADFGDGLLLPAGDEYMIYSPLPAIDPSISGTIYIVLSVNADTQNVQSNLGWRMR